MTTNGHGEEAPIAAPQHLTHDEFIAECMKDATEQALDMPASIRLRFVEEARALAEKTWIDAVMQQSSLTAETKQ